MEFTLDLLDQANKNGAEEDAFFTAGSDSIFMQCSEDRGLITDVF